MGLGETTILLKVAIVLALGGILLHLIGLATPYWTDYAVGAGTLFSINYHAGLWQLCIASICGEFTNESSWLEACQAFAILGFLAGVATIVLIFLYVFIEKMKTDLFYMVAALGNLVAAGCIFLTVVIYGAKSHVSLSWSFGLSIVGMILHAGAGVLMVVNRFQNKA